MPKLNKYALRRIRREELEKAGFHKLPERLNEKDFLLLNAERTVERKYQRFLQYLRERDEFESDFRRRYPDYE